MSEASISPTALIAGRHIAGMAIVALANPLIYHGGGLYQWSVTLGAALLGAGVVYGLYALFFTKRAKAAWPGSFFVLAWVLLALATLGPWMDRSPRQEPTAQAAPPPGDGSGVDWEKGEYTPPPQR